MKKPELLAPAGDIEALRAAVAAGADAIYIGGTKFGARAYAKGIGDGELKEALDYCHLRGRKLYLTVNTLLKEKELNDELVEFLRPAYEAGLDAVIVQDYGVLKTIREHFPDLPIHASTQMCVSSPYGMNLLRQMGVSRVVFPRELTLQELRRAIEVAGERNTASERNPAGEGGGLETEVFVHGALCYCVSGNCLMSSIIGGRSGNRGRCAQVCRLPFPDEHLLNLKDLATLSILPDIIETGVTSLKIEGRMKSPRYTAGVTSVYRKYIDKYIELREGTSNLGSASRPGMSATEAKETYKVASSDTHILTELFNRGGYTTGYFEMHNGKKMIFKGEKPEMRTPDEAVIKRIDERYINKPQKEKAHAKVTIIAGRPAKMELSCNGHKIEVIGGEAQEAEKKPLSEEDVKAKLSKFGDSNFELEKLEINLRGRVFMPVSTLNQLRRDAIEALEEKMLQSYRRRSESNRSESNRSGSNRSGSNRSESNTRGGEA